MQNFFYYSVPSKGLLTFLYEDQIISVQNTINILTAQELIDSIRQAEDNQVGVQSGTIATASGKDALTESTFTGITVTLLEGWTIYSQKSSGSFSVADGNIIRHDGTTPFYPNTSITYQQVLTQGGVLFHTSSGSGLSTEEHNQLMALPTANQVWNTELNAETWSSTSFGAWVKGLLSKIFYVSYE
jgi:hypothetical protein